MRYFGCKLESIGKIARKSIFDKAKRNVYWENPFKLNDVCWLKPAISCFIDILSVFMII